MKKYILFLLLLFVNTMLFSLSFHIYDQELVATFPIGSGDGELSFDEMIYDGPSTFAFDVNGNLFISDSGNGRLIKFDNEFNYSGEYTNCYSATAFRLFINSKGEFITYNLPTFGVDTPAGEKKIWVNLNLYTGYRYLKRYDFIYYNNIVFAYPGDGTLLCLPDPGTDSKKNNEKFLRGKDSIINYLLQTKAKDQDSIKIDEKNRIFINNELMTLNFKRYREYWKEKYQTNKNSSQDINENLVTYLGKDTSKNTYWSYGGVLIYNKSGILIEMFKTRELWGIILPVIHPGGDVYYLHYESKKFYLYKVKKVW